MEAASLVAAGMLTLSVFNNTGLAGTPIVIRTVRTTTDGFGFTVAGYESYIKIILTIPILSVQHVWPC
jgi:hypothetical protein